MNRALWARTIFKDILLIIICTTSLACGFYFVAYYQYLLRQESYKIAIIQREMDRLEQAKTELGLEIEYLSGPRQVWRRATNELGMIPGSLDDLTVLSRQ